jgi:hypothetical protein
MNLCEEICGFISGYGLKCELSSICGTTVIHTDRNSAIFLIPVDAEDVDKAEIQADSLKKAIAQHQADTGEYPLIITEDRWRSQSDMMKARLLAHLRIFTQIYARNCEVRKIDKQTAAEFLDKNHSYSDAACRYRYGLYLKRHTGHNAGSTEVVPGTLVAVATFSNARKWIKGDKTIRSYEWTRYASLPGVRLSGGMGKFLNTFIEEVNPDDIMTYADLEWSEGKVYEQLGFQLEGVKKPIVFQIDASWKRFPVKPGMTEGVSEGMTEGSSLPAKTGNLFYQNLGSNKYRLKLTDYQ